MSEDHTASEEPQAGAPEPTNNPQPQAGTTSTEPQAGDRTEPAAPESISLEEAKKLRSEAANLRKRMKAFEDAEQAAKDAQLSEIERAKKQAADLQAQYEALIREHQELKVTTRVMQEASKLQFRRPEIAAKLLDWADIDYDDAGMPTNIDKLLSTLLKNMPELGNEQPHATPPTEQANAQSAASQTPALPAMAPGRTSIPAPGTTPPGKPPTLADVYSRTRRP